MPSACGFAPSSAQIDVHGSLQRRENQLVAAQRAEKRVALDRGNQFRFARDDAGLRAAQQLIAAEADQVHAAAQHLGGRGLVFEASHARGFNHRAAAQILHKRDALLAGECRNLLGRRATPQSRP